jgi:A/G-specific adenine glycosylase
MGTPQANADEAHADEAPWVSELLAWFDRHARDLPWRAAGTSPWGVLISEVMLQQTPARRVEPVWLDWLRLWPTPGALAVESPGEAVRAWGKLGYPRRALRLHECAVALVDRHDGRVPDEVTELLALPGIGAYTARAVATFAYGQRHPVVDTNVRRVVARLVDGQGEPGPPATSRDLAAVDRLLPGDQARAARFSIALMELGALVCPAAAPRCSACPVAGHCRWRAAAYPTYTGPRARPQRFAGTDRQVRGRLLDVLRATAEPVTRAQLDLAWPEPVQRNRALDTLVADGLLDPLPDGRFALPGRETQNDL